MALKKIAIQGGVVKDDTVYSSEGRWVDSDKVRFYNGRAQKIGGWEKTINDSFGGAARALHSWRDFNDNRLLAIGTHTNIYILKDGILYDITPADPSFSTVTLDLQDTGSNQFHPAIASTDYGHMVCYYPQAKDSTTSVALGTDTQYGDQERDYGWAYSTSPDISGSSGTNARSEGPILRFYKSSHGVPTNGSNGTPIAYYFNNLNIGEIRIPKLSATIVNNTTNYFDILLPSTYDSGTILNYTSIAGYTARGVTAYFLGSETYSPGSSYYIGGAQGPNVSRIGHLQTQIRWSAPFDTTGRVMIPYATQNTSNTFFTAGTRTGVGNILAHQGTHKISSQISDASLANHMLGNVVTDKNNRPCARRVVVGNHGINLPSSGYPNYTTPYQYGCYESYTDSYPSAYIGVTGKTYEGTTVTESIYILGVQGFSNAESKITYSKHWYAEIDDIYYVKLGSTGGANTSNPHNTDLDNGWDLLGSVTVGLSRETQSTAYDASLTAFPAISSGGTTDVTITKPVESGEEHSNFAYGWGTGVWQAGSSYTRGWGQPASTSNVVVDPRVWSFDNFGEDLVLAHNNGAPHYWDTSGGVGTAAVQITNATNPSTPQSGRNNSTHGIVPTSVKSIFVTSPDRHIVCLGAGDPMKVRWASQETTNIWTENVDTNTSGGQILTGGTFLVGYAKVRGQTLLFSDKNVHGMVFQGPPYTFGFKELGNNCGLISPHGAMAIQGRCYWMGFKNFFVFDGGVKVLPSPVAKYVFEDFNYAEQFKVVTGTSRGYNEIWWFYPSISTNDETTSTNAAGQNRENNRYVKYNYLENVWDVGTFSRTAWEGGSIFENDISADANRVLYSQEVGTTDDGLPINAFVESADFDIDDGQNIMFVDKALPDATSTDKEDGTYDETYNITFSSRKDSLGDYTTKGPFTVRNRDVTISGVNYSKTGRINPRVRGRQMKVKVHSDGLHDHWRLGDLRLNMRPDGER